MRVFGRNRKFSSIVLVIVINMLLLAASLALGSSEESGGGGVTVIPDWTVFIQLINFLLILWILNRILYRPIRNILRQRKEKMDGLELIRNALIIRPKLDILVITANDSLNMIQSAEQAGARKTFSKPIPFKELSGTIQALI